MKNRPRKGDFNYLSWQKKYTSVRSAAFFGIVLAVFIIGLITTKTRNNMLTVVAILGVLPAGKSLVNTFMYIRFKEVEESFHKILQPFEKNVHILYNMAISSSEKITFIDCIAVFEQSVYLYSPDKKTDTKNMEKYLKNILSNSGKGNVNLKFYQSEKEFVKRLSQLKRDNDESNSSESRIIEIIGSFCL